MARYNCSTKMSLIIWWEKVIGPLEGFIGLVEEIDMEKQKVKVKVSMFGRETSAELDLSQVKPL